MQLQRNTNHAVRILQYLHLNPKSKPTAMTVAHEVGITYPIFIKIAGQLKEKGLIVAEQGRKGGYKLGRSAHTISVYDVFLCVEGELQLHPVLQEGQPCDKDKMHDLMRSTGEAIIKKMSSVSIAALASDSPAERLHDTAQALKTQTGRLYRVETIDNGDHEIPFDEIIFIQSSPQQGILELHHTHGLLEFRGQISRAATNIPEFFRSHMSVIVNIKHIIKDIDMEKREIALTNGRVVPIAKQKIAALSYLMMAHTQSVG